jgi:ribosome-associated protein
VSEREYPEGLKIAPGVIVPLSEVELRTSRSSGPGGQHANVTDSRVEAVFDVVAAQSLPDAVRSRLLERLGPRVSAVAQDARSQYRNRELALERLRGRLSDALRERRPRRPTVPGRGARERRLAEKRRQAERKHDRQAPGAGEE